ncbi:MAG: hypothetical protein JW870_11245 [Candidatus Delongbacteria bacterium]|nr:hypothetical protein [Candidatus Delongbacteria bacterium]
MPFCPICGYSIKKIEIDIKDKVCWGVNNKIHFSSQGQYEYILEEITLDEKSIWGDEELIISPNTPKDLNLIIPDEFVDKECLIKFSFNDNFNYEKKIFIANYPDIKFVIQDYQELSAREILDGKNEVYLTIYKNTFDIKFIKDANFTVENVILSSVSDNEISFLKKKETFELAYDKFVQSDDAVKKLSDLESLECALSIYSTTSSNIILPLKIRFVPIPIISITNEHDVLKQKISENKENLIDVVLGLSDDIVEKGTEIRSLSIKSLTTGISILGSTQGHFDNDNKFCFQIKINLKEVPDKHIEINNYNKKIIKYSIKIEFLCFDEPDIKCFFLIENLFHEIYNIYENVDIITRIALDFGTSTSCIAYGDDLYVNNNIKYFPTTVKFRNFYSDLFKSDIVLFKDIYEGDKPLAYAENFKTMLPWDIPRLYKDRSNKPQYLKASDITLLFIKRLIEDFIFNTRKKPQRIIYTYPASFMSVTSKLLSDILKKIDPEIMVMDSIKLTEPEAIAIYYISNNDIIKDKIASQNNDREIIIAIYDCGGGTTDYSIVSVKNIDRITKMSVLATWGTEEFSGTFLNYIIGKNSDKEDEYPDDYSSILSGKGDKKTKDKIVHFRNRNYYLNSIKVDLARCETEQEMIEILTKIDQNADLIIGSLKREIKSSINILLSLTKNLYDNNLLEDVNPDFVILAGNSCKFPIFRWIAKEFYDESSIIYDDEHLKDCVSLGAILYSQIAENLIVDGLNRSCYEFYKKTGLFDTEICFKQWLTMDDPHEYESKPVKEGYRIEPTIYYKMNIFNTSSDDKLKNFAIPLPELNNNVKKQFFKLKYYNFKLYYKWFTTDKEDNLIETEWKQIIL